jgi:hypothetical protein
MSDGSSGRCSISSSAKFEMCGRNEERELTEEIYMKLRKKDE